MLPIVLSYAPTEKKTGGTKCDLELHSHPQGHSTNTLKSKSHTVCYT